MSWGAFQTSPRTRHHQVGLWPNNRYVAYRRPSDAARRLAFEQAGHQTFLEKAAFPVIALRARRAATVHCRRISWGRAAASKDGSRAAVRVRESDTLPTYR